jgi:hypothetical protein
MRNNNFDLTLLYRKQGSTHQKFFLKNLIYFKFLTIWQKPEIVANSVYGHFESMLLTEKV